LEAPEADPAHDELPSLPEEGEAGDGRLPVAPLAFSAWSGFVGAVGAAKDKPELVADSRHERADPLDPETRHAAQWAPCFEPPPAEARSTPPAEGAAARASLESLLPELVDKVAWSCDRRRGSMRLELRAGALAGGSVVVHADEGKVRVEIRTPPGADVEEWRSLLHARLLQRGIDLEHLSVE